MSEDERVFHINLLSLPVRVVVDVDGATIEIVVNNLLFNNSIALAQPLSLHRRSDLATATLILNRLWATAFG